MKKSLLTIMLSSLFTVGFTSVTADVVNPFTVGSGDTVVNPVNAMPAKVVDTVAKVEEAPKISSAEQFKRIFEDVTKEENVDSTLQDVSKLKAITQKKNAENNLKEEIVRSADLDAKYKETLSKESKIVIEKSQEEKEKEEKAKKEKEEQEKREKALQIQMLAAQTAGHVAINPVTQQVVPQSNDTLEAIMLYSSNGVKGAQIKLNDTKHRVKVGSKVGKYTVKSINVDTQEVILEKDGVELSSVSLARPSVPTVQMVAPQPTPNIIYPYDVSVTKE